jgi:hypothetical protein
VGIVFVVGIVVWPHSRPIVVTAVFVEVLAVDQAIAADLLLGLRKRGR